MTPELYLAIATRANGACECGCGVRCPPGEVDHFFGRAKADENEATCWLLTPRCHFEKTRNYPDARTWVLKYIRHCETHGYAQALARTQMRLEWITARASFPWSRA